MLGDPDLRVLYRPEAGQWGSGKTLVRASVWSEPKAHAQWLEGPCAISGLAPFWVSLIERFLHGQLLKARLFWSHILQFLPNQNLVSKSSNPPVTELHLEDLLGI